MNTMTKTIISGGLSAVLLVAMIATDATGVGRVHPGTEAYFERVAQTIGDVPLQSGCPVEPPSLLEVVPTRATEVSPQVAVPLHRRCARLSMRRYRGEKRWRQKEQSGRPHAASMSHIWTLSRSWPRLALLRVGTLSDIVLR